MPRVPRSVVHTSGAHLRSLAWYASSEIAGHLTARAESPPSPPRYKFTRISDPFRGRPPVTGRVQRADGGQSKRLTTHASGAPRRRRGVAARARCGAHDVL